MERIKKIKWMAGIGWLFIIYCLCVGFSFAAPYLGDFPEDQAIYYLWNSCDSDGASITRATDGTISIYKDNSDALTYDTTQVTHDVTDTEDFDSLTGVHMIVVGGTNSWFETGHDYVAVLSAATIDGQTVNASLFSWSYENRFDEVDVVEYKGNAVSATVNGIPDVNVTYWEDDAVPSTADGTPAVNVEEWNDTDVPADVQAGYPTVTIKDGTGTGEIDTDSGTVLLRSATETQIDNIETDTAAQDTSTEIRILMTGADTPVAKDSTPLTAAETEAEVEDALQAVQLDHLAGVTTGVAADSDLETYCVAGSLFSHLFSVGADITTFKPSTDSPEALRNQGDSAWITATGFSTLTTSDNIGINWGDISNPTTTVGLTNTTVGIVTTNSDMRGTDGANTTVPDAAGVAPTTAEIKTAMEAEGTSDLDAIADAVSSYLDAAVSGRAPASEYDTQMGYIPSNLGDVPTSDELDTQHGDGRWTTY